MYFEDIDSNMKHKYCLKETIIHRPPRTILVFSETHHFCGIFHSHTDMMLFLKYNSSSISKVQMTHFQNINSLIAFASGPTSSIDNNSNGLRMKPYICLDKRKKLTGVSWHCDVISKFNPAWDPLLCVVSTLWSLLTSLTSCLLVTHWSSLDHLPKINFLCPPTHTFPPLLGFLGNAGFSQFCEQRKRWVDLLCLPNELDLWQINRAHYKLGITDWFIEEQDG